MTGTLRRRATAAAAALTVLLLAACGSGDDSTDASSGEAPAHDDVLTVVRADEPISLDWKNSGDLPDVFVLSSVMETLTAIDMAASTTVPRLATEWSVTDDLLHWTFTLREGVTYHNGAAFDADTVAYTFQTLLDSEDDSKASAVSNVASVTVLGDYEVQVDLIEPDAIFDRRMARLEMAEPTFDAEHESDAASVVNGTGPYKLESWERGKQVTLIRNDDYWGEPASIEKVVVIWRAETSVRASMVATGEADLAWDIAPEDFDSVPVLEEQRTINTVWMRPDTDGDNPALADVRVRQAMRTAADMETVAATIFKDVVSVVGGNQNVPPGSVGYIDDLEPWPYDMDEATDLVAEAAADGVDVTVPITINLRNGGGQFPGDAEFAEYLVQQWQAIGLTGARIQSLDTSAWVAAHTSAEPGQPHAELSYSSSDNALLDYGQQATRYLLCDGRYSLYCDPEADALIQAASVTLGDERQAAFEKVGEYLEEQVPMFNFGNLTQYFGLVEGLDWEPDGRESPMFDAMSWAE